MGRRWAQSYVKGQDRLHAALKVMPEEWDSLHFYTNGYPIGCPLHRDVPFAFKAYALKEASSQANLLLWCDSCIIPIRPLEEIWRRAQLFGVWLGKNGWKNSDWTAQEAIGDLFPGVPIEKARQLNTGIEHVVATAFALDLEHPNGRDFLKEYFRLASETRAFCGPISNSNHPEKQWSGDAAKCAPCGPPDVRGHRHDQTAASVIAWRLGIQLTDPPHLFSYPGNETEKTVLVADGAY